MFIEEMQILVDCKRLVEKMLEEKKLKIEYADKCGRLEAIPYLQRDIDRLEAALQGEGVK